ncbi:hypothetical protein E2C01_072952 [Portunus trituberculatus]|uniref:Uncharacterized protein n=2 Tax=Portunus trituberculatus TaxID=210409 RepID=A0A5B7I8J5_PORTR|nr:hypothetical protein [Portunus trituberculatus]
MFQGGVCGAGEEGGGGGAGESGPAAATVVRTESHLARFNTARALFEKMGQGEARPVAPRANATAPAVVKAPPAKAEPEVPRGVATRGGVGSVRRPLGDGGDSHLSPRGDSLSPASSRSTSPSPARPAANGHAHHEEGPRTGLASLGGLRRPGSASSRSLSASSTDSDPPQRRWPPARAADPPADQPDPARRWPPPARGTEPPRTNGEGVRRASRPEKPVKPESLEKRAPAGGHDAHQELLARHKNWFQSFAKNRSTTAAPGRPLSPSKGDARPASPTKSDGGGAPLSPAKEEPRCDDWRAALSSRPDLRSPRAGQESERATTPRGRDEAPEGTTTTTPPSSTTSTTSTSIITTTVTSSATNNNIITPITTAINNNNNNSTCLTTTTTATTTTITTTTSSSLTTSSLTTTTTTTTTTSGRAAAGGSGGANEQEAWTSVLQTRYGTRARPDLYSPR